MYYELSQCQNTGNWWIWRVHEDGFREIAITLSADLTVQQAHRYLDAWVEKMNG